MVLTTDWEKTRKFLLKNKQLPMYYDLANEEMPYSVFIDNPKNIGCVVIEYVAKYYYAVFGLNEKTLDDVYKQFLSNKKVCVGAMDTRVMEVYKKYGFVYEYDEVCKIYEFGGEYTPNANVEYDIRDIKVKDFKVVKNFHKYGATLKEITECARMFPTSAAYVDGQMVSWCMLHENRSMGPMYTLPEWRGKNLAVYVTNDLVGKMLKKGMAPYFMIVKGNESSEKLSEKVGFAPNGIEVGWCVKQQAEKE